MQVIRIYNAIMNSDHRIFSLSAESEQAKPDEAVHNEIGRPWGVPRVLSQTIFAGAQELEIEHNGILYRLRQTSLGKLILTK